MGPNQIHELLYSKEIINETKRQTTEKNTGENTRKRYN